jgi:tetratricopeptide (TPR) repeat protein
MCQLVSNWLDNEEVSGWLIIVDNADDAGLFLHGTVIGEKSGSGRTIVDYLPKQLNTKRCMIVTTRNRDIGEALAHGEPCIEVGPFSIEESINLLRSKGRGVINHVDGPAMEKLVEKLGRIPLAIAQAAAYMNRNRISVPKYLAALEKDEQNLIDYLSVELQDHRRPRGHPNSIFRTWRLSFEQIRLHDVRAAELLSLMAMLDGQQIPQDLAQRNDERDVDFLTALGTLAGYSLVMPSGEEVWTMHALVQLSVQDWLAAAQQRTNMVEEAVRLVAARFPNSEHENRARCEALLPHARAVLRHASGSDSSIKDCATLLHNVGCFEMQQGKFAQAQESVQKAYELRREVLGNNDVSTIGSLDLFGQVLGYRGMYQQAGEILRQSLDLYKTVLGKEHPDTFRSMNNLAEVLWYQGKYEQAREMHGQALRLRETMLGKEHPDTLTSMDNLALVLGNQGKYEQAEEMHRQALRLRETVLGKEHPETLTSMNNLALVLSSQGKYEQAEEIHRQAIRLGETVLGKEHPDTLTSTHNLASALSNQGKYEQAEEMHEQVLRLRETVLGKEHPHTLTGMADLAFIYWNQRQWGKAEILERRVMETRSRLLGHRHPDTLTAMANLAYTWESQGQYQNAIDLMRQVESLQREILGIDHPDTTASSETVDRWVAADVKESAGH